MTDIIGNIIGIKIIETIPDTIFNNADEVILVDLPPDELLTRLREGKVYIPERAQIAIDNFFRKGNLIALRELALRRVADRVDAQMQEYREDQSIEKVWLAKERLLVCVGPEESGLQIIRKAYRMAASLRADWFAVYIETPELQKLPKNKRDQILKNLQLAQKMGAETNILAGSNASEVLIGYARSHNISKIVVGKTLRSSFSRFIKPSLAELLLNKQEEIDIYIVERKSEPSSTSDFESSMQGFEFDVTPKTYWPGYWWGILACLLVTILSASLIHYLQLANIAMLYLLAVAIIATRFGRGPSLMTSVISVIIFVFYFATPSWNSVISNWQYLLTFLVMLTVALIISNLTSDLRFQAWVAMHRQRRTSAVNALSKELATALSIPQVIEISLRHLSNIFHTQASILLPDDNMKVQPISDAQLKCDTTIAQWVYNNELPAGTGTQTLPAGSILYLPLKAPMRIRGVLAIIPEKIFLPEQQRLLDNFCNQIALSIEHLHYIAVARDALLSMESERLRDAVLNVISRALYQPLTSVLGLSESLALYHHDHQQRIELINRLREESGRVHALVTNLLDMSRLQVGDIELNKQWCDLREIIYQAVNDNRIMLASHQVIIQIPETLPPIHFDPVLMKRVFNHLLENAAEYTPPGSEVNITAKKLQNDVLVLVEDNGPGLPENMEKKIFEKFIRGGQEPAFPRIGLGLAICRAILEAHGGEIFAKPPPRRREIFYHITNLRIAHRKLFSRYSKGNLYFLSPPNNNNSRVLAKLQHFVIASFLLTPVCFFHPENTPIFCVSLVLQRYQWEYCVHLSLTRIAFAYLLRFRINQTGFFFSSKNK